MDEASLRLKAESVNQKQRQWIPAFARNDNLRQTGASDATDNELEPNGVTAAKAEARQEGLDGDEGVSPMTRPKDPSAPNY